MTSRLVALIALCLSACGGKVGDGAGRSDAEVLQDEHDRLCARICDKIMSCGDVGDYEPADAPRCEASCAEVATDALDSGDRCAALTLDAFRCYDALSCAEIGTRNVGDCEDQMEAAARCGGGPADATGDTATADPSAGEPGVACWEGGRAPGDMPAVGEVVCEQGCSGSLERSVTCSQDVEALHCECFEDGELVHSFEALECGGDMLADCP